MPGEMVLDSWSHCVVHAYMHPGVKVIITGSIPPTPTHQGVGGGVGGWIRRSVGGWVPWTRQVCVCGLWVRAGLVGLGSEHCWLCCVALTGMY